MLLFYGHGMKSGNQGETKLKEQWVILQSRSGAFCINFWSADFFFFLYIVHSIWFAAIQLQWWLQKVLKEAKNIRKNRPSSAFMVISV